MSISDLFESGIQKSNIIHFAAITNIAAIDGEINPKEEILLRKFAIKLDIDKAHYEEVIKNPSKYPMSALHHKEERLEHIYDLFKMIYADHEINEPEAKLIYKYALGMGCSDASAKEVIAKSIKFFEGQISFKDYQYLIKNN